jgi:hypothetical protein
MEAGEPVTRTITLSALGQIETQLPAVETPEVDGLNVYADKPELRRELEAGGIRGVRQDQYAIIGLAGGEMKLPAVEVPWWDVAAGEWKIATLPERTLEVRGVEAIVPVLPPAVEEELAAPVAEPEAVAPSETAVATVDSFWQRATEIIALLWILTLAAWWWSSRTRAQKPRKVREPKEPPVHKQQAALLKTARKAAADGDGSGVRGALLDWGRLQWPGNAPRSIGEFASRMAPPLADELRKLSSVSYGPSGGDFDRDALAGALRQVAILEEHAPAKAQDLLPPLMPPAA